MTKHYGGDPGGRPVNRVVGGRPVLPRYERIVFEKERVLLPGKPQAALLSPGHPLLDATIACILEQHRGLLMQGTALVDETDRGQEPRVLCYLEHTIQDARLDEIGQRRVVSRQMHFIEINAHGTIHNAGYAPFLDYRPLRDDEQALLSHVRSAPWLHGDLEAQARSYAITQVVPLHLEEVRTRREAQINKTEAAVNERLTKEISYWDNRAAHLKEQEAAGKTNARLNSQIAQQRADELQARLTRRLAELDEERKLSPLPPVVIGGLLVIPQGLIDALTGKTDPALPFAHETRRVELLAMQAVMQRERSLGYEPRDVSAAKCGYDIESRVPATGQLRFIEVKGRIKGAENIIVTKNEILTALNTPDAFILAIVEVDGEDSKQTTTHYLMRPFQREPDFGATCVVYDLAQLLSKGTIV